MQYLQLIDIQKSYGVHVILKDVSLMVNTGQRVGLVGANGVGKSTLLKIITGEVEADGGTIRLSPGMQLGYLAQTLSNADDKTLAEMIGLSLAHVYDLENRMRDLEARMGQVEGDVLNVVLAQYGEISDQYERAGGYDLDYGLETVLNGLGVSYIPREQVFGTLSGGEKTRVGLALLLLRNPDVLLLDEPTNHLDQPSLEWLETYLIGYRGAVLVVSHDRQFLNRITNVIVEIDEHSHTARRYSGDYDAYREAKRREREQWASDYAAQQEEIKTLRLAIKETARRNNNYRTHKDNDKFVRNLKRANHEDTVSRRVASAEEKLKRIEANLIPEPPEDLQFAPDFDPVMFGGRYPLAVYNLSKAFGGRVVLDNVSLSLHAHSRVLLVGENGAGKSTLLRLLAGIEQADSGEIAYSPGVQIGYLDQEARGLAAGVSAFEAYRRDLPETDQRLMAILLQSGLLRYDELERPVDQLSSGQRRKLQIARMIAGRANLLILDEPTNYISFDVLESLEAALRDFPGPVIAASHDRRFIAQFGGEVWRLEDGKLRVETQIEMTVSDE